MKNKPKYIKALKRKFHTFKTIRYIINKKHKNKPLVVNILKAIKK